MADTVTIPATGTGTATPVIATDDISSVHYQRIKLVHGADGTNDGDVATGNPLPVRSRMVTCSTTVTRAANMTPYTGSPPDNVGSTPSGGYTITSAARASGGSGIITDMFVQWDDVTTIKMQGEVWITDTAITEAADNAAMTLTDTEAKTVVGIIPFTLFAGPSGDMAHVQNLSVGFTTVGSANLRFAVITRAACTPIANSSILTFRFKILQVD